jgi:phosphoribosylaminoimidazole-succinocarboxamide synthase
MRISQIALRLGQSLLRITAALATVLGLLLAAILAVTTMPGSSHRGAPPPATAEQQAQMKALTYQVNDVLKPLFAAGGMLLVDFKLEFGLFQGQVVLGDEFSPDGCRLWDAETRKKLDKDRFRQGLGGVVEAYEEVAHRLGVDLSGI